MEIERAVNGLAALAQESRLAVFRLLVTAGPEGLPAGSISERLAIPAATLSFHLKTLAQADLVKSRSAGRFVYYSANFAAMSALLEFLTQDCCGGRPGLCLPAQATVEPPKPRIKSRAQR
ncbi:MAG: helix-turn-helix transcriptional regulator [Betaproteobacteria bacterium]|nr:helix-turn-helix transcriptional regulator [Betaproteobacteria bacterium]